MQIVVTREALPTATMHDLHRREANCRPIRDTLWSRMRDAYRIAIRVLALAFLLAGSKGFAQQTISLPIPGTHEQIQADLYGGGKGGGKNDAGKRGIILAHGGQFHRESWRKQAQILADRGFAVLAISFRGDHNNPDGSPGSFGSTPDNATDVLAAVAYLQKKGIKRISAVGASMGGDAVGEADVRSAPGEIESVVFLGSEGGDFPAKLKGRKLFLVARDDSSSYGPRLPGISSHFAKAPQPKKLIVVEGSAHAQFLFDTEQGPRAIEEILRFVSNP